jgi:hypothetical protein
MSIKRCRSAPKRRGQKPVVGKYGLKVLSVVWQSEEQRGLDLNTQYPYTCVLKPYYNINYRVIGKTASGDKAGPGTASGFHVFKIFELASFSVFLLPLPLSQSSPACLLRAVLFLLLTHHHKSGHHGCLLGSSASRQVLVFVSQNMTDSSNNHFYVGR